MVMEISGWHGLGLENWVQEGGGWDYNRASGGSLVTGE